VGDGVFGVDERGDADIREKGGGRVLRVRWDLSKITWHIHPARLRGDDAAAIGGRHQGVSLDPDGGLRLAQGGRLDLDGDDDSQCDAMRPLGILRAHVSAYRDLTSLVDRVMPTKVITDRALAGKYAANWTEHFRHSEPYAGR
jgi:hypothetical protein